MALGIGRPCSMELRPSSASEGLLSMESEGCGGRGSACSCLAAGASSPRGGCSSWEKPASRLF
jgi:hypothetical protein